MRRAAVVAVGGVLLLMLLGVLRMRQDVGDELRAAQRMAELAERLSGLAALPDDAARAALMAWREGGDLRHLSVRVVDAHGSEVLRAGADHTLPASMRALAQAGAGWFSSTPPFTVAWALPRPQGGAWQASLSAAPESERVEAIGTLLEGAAVMSLVALAMLVVMHWNTRRALAPMSLLLDAIGELEAPERSGRASRVAALPTMPVTELETIASALRHLDAAQTQTQQDRRRLARQMMSLQEDERARLARELHDEFGQRLTALRVNAAWLARRVEGNDELLPVVRDMAEQCEGVQHDIRDTLARLRPWPATEGEAAPRGETLAQLGEMLQGLVQGWQRGAGQPTDYRLTLEMCDASGDALDWAAHAAQWRLPREAALAVYRISQEALTNVARHAHARTALLALSVRLPARHGAPLRLEWVVDDDGDGLDDPAAAARRGNGLAGLTERLWALGADLHIGAGRAPPARHGCHLSASIEFNPVPGALS